MKNSILQVVLLITSLLAIISCGSNEDVSGILTTNTGMISGTLLDSNGTVADSLQLSLMKENGEVESYFSPDGHFEFDSLTPGEYTIQVFDSESLIGNSGEIDLEAGESIVINITVQINITIINIGTQINNYYGDNGSATGSSGEEGQTSSAIDDSGNSSSSAGENLSSSIPLSSQSSSSNFTSSESTSSESGNSQSGLCQEVLGDDEICDSKDGNIYPTVIIGDQKWMAENLNFDDNFVHGSSLHLNDESSELAFGYSYEWDVAVVNGLCPTGYHLPDMADWEELASWVASRDVFDNVQENNSWVALAKHLKADNDSWNFSNGVQNLDTYGFAALSTSWDSGTSNGFIWAGVDAYFWSGSDSTADYAYAYHMSYFNDKFKRKAVPKAYRISIRCLEE